MYFNYLFNNTKWAEAASSADSFINNKNQFSGYCSLVLRNSGCSNYIRGFNNFISKCWQRVLPYSIPKTLSLFNYLWHYHILFHAILNLLCFFCLKQCYIYVIITWMNRLGNCRDWFFFLKFLFREDKIRKAFTSKMITFVINVTETPIFQYIL